MESITQLIAPALFLSIIVFAFFYTVFAAFRHSKVAGVFLILAYLSPIPVIWLIDAIGIETFSTINFVFLVGIVWWSIVYSSQTKHFDKSAIISVIFFLVIVCPYLLVMDSAVREDVFDNLISALDVYLSDRFFSLLQTSGTDLFMAFIKGAFFDILEIWSIGENTGAQYSALGKSVLVLASTAGNLASVTLILITWRKLSQLL